MEKKRKRYKFKSFIFHMISILVLIIPLLGWILYRRADYFVTGGTKLAIGFIIGLVFVLLVVKGALTKINETSRTIINLSILLALTHFLEAVLNDLFWLTGAAIVGYILYIPFNLKAVRFGKLADIIDEESLRVEVRGTSGRV